MKSSTDLDHRVLYEDNHLIIVNKLPGELVQGDKTGDETLADKVKDYIKIKHSKPGNVYLGIPHRLDRPVSGIVTYTKTSKGLSRMNEVFRSKSIYKEYWAIVQGRPKSNKGRLIDYLAKNEKQNKSYVVDASVKGAKEAILDYRVICTGDRYTLVSIDLHTGRHHQIRTQLAHMGNVIKGDVKYGAKRSNDDASIDLHSRSVRYKHPVKEETIDLSAPCPKGNLWRFFEQKVAS